LAAPSSGDFEPVAPTVGKCAPSAATGPHHRDSIYIALRVFERLPELEDPVQGEIAPAGIGLGNS